MEMKSYKILTRWCHTPLLSLLPFSSLCFFLTHGSLFKEIVFESTIVDVVKLLEGRDGFSSKENFLFLICLHSHLVLESSLFIYVSRNAARAYKC